MFIHDILLIILTFAYVLFERLHSCKKDKDICTDPRRKIKCLSLGRLRIDSTKNIPNNYFTLLFDELSTHIKLLSDHCCLFKKYKQVKVQVNYLFRGILYSRIALMHPFLYTFGLPYLFICISDHCCLYKKYKQVKR